MKTVTVLKVATLGRVYLGKDLMDKLALGIGDYVQFVEDDGRVFVEKITPAAET